MNKTKTTITISVISAVCFFVFGGATFGVKDQQAISEESKKIELEYWRVAFDTNDGFNQLITDFNASHPNIEISLKTFAYQDYEKELINALASGNGPDIFSFHNDELPKYVDKLYPMPLTYTELVSSGSGCKSEKTSTNYFYNTRSFQETFADIATADLVQDGYIMGVPLYIDSLALFYNKALLNSAGISNPPSTWNEFKEAVKKLTKKSDSGTIINSAVAMGTADNISRSPDILQLLMLQNGTEMNSADKKSVVFDKSIVTDQGTYYPGQASLEFYTDFSNPSKTVYTWDQRQNFSIDAFASGQVAMMFHYAYQVDLVKEKAPNLNFGIASAPQIDGNTAKVNFANYFAEGVSKQSENPEEAWEFLYFLTQKENALKLNRAIKRPTARRDLIVEQENDEIINGIYMKPFTDQVLTSKSWYKINNSLIEKQFAEMINNVNLGKYTAEKAINNATSAINILMPSVLPTIADEFLPEDNQEQ